MPGISLNKGGLAYHRSSTRWRLTAVAAITGLAALCFCTRQMPFSNSGSNTSGQAVGSAPVRIISPYGGEVVRIGNTVLFQAVVGDSLFDSAGGSWQGTVSFYANGSFIAKDSTAPYSCVFTPLQAGSVVLFAAAQSQAGYASSDTVRVTVKDAFITLVSPQNGKTFITRDTVPISAALVAGSKHVIKAGSRIPRDNRHCARYQEQTRHRNGVDYRDQGGGWRCKGKNRRFESGYDYRTVTRMLNEGRDLCLFPALFGRHQRDYIRVRILRA